MNKEKPLIDKASIGIIVTLALAVLAGGVAWGVNSQKINQTMTRTIEIKESLSFRMRRMEARTDRRFNKLDRKLDAILKAIIGTN